MGNMSKNNLRTLKDIKLSYEREANIRRSIRKEAIKWVKHYRGLASNSPSKYDKHRALNKALALMEFNNITEDDLK